MILKKFSPGKIKRKKVECCMLLTNDGTLTLTGALGNEPRSVNFHKIFRTYNRNAKYEIGDIALTPPFYNPRYFFDIWNDFNMNDVRPGCGHTEHLDPDRMIKLGDMFARAGDILTAEHPAGLLGKVCPVCHAVYGATWRRVEIPPEAVLFLQNIRGENFIL